MFDRNVCFRLKILGWTTAMCSTEFGRNNNRAPQPGLHAKKSAKKTEFIFSKAAHHTVRDWPRSNYDWTLFDPWFDPVQPMIRPRLTHDSTHNSPHDLTLFDPWFDPAKPMIRPVRLMIWPCLTHDSALFDSWFDPVWPMIWPCSTHHSSLFDPWFDPFRLIIWPHFESRFDPVRLMIRPCLSHLFFVPCFFFIFLIF